VFKKPPFHIEEKGWGEFDMSIVLSTIGKGGEHTLDHDLNFQSERYEARHQVVSEQARGNGERLLTASV
jgi:transcription initiation factor IIF auxiliary subunit